MYLSLADSLRDEIREGRYQVGQMIATEHELVRQRRVSRVTVRRASEILIGEGLIERRPGKGLFVTAATAAKTAMIQMVVGNLEWIPSVRTARGVQQAAAERGVQVQIYDAHGSMAADLEMLRRLPDGGAKGAVIHALHAPAFTEALYGLRARGFPFVLVDQRLRDLAVPSVLADNVAGGHQLGGLLLAAGHRRIAFVGDLLADTVRDRLAGLRDAVGDAGLPFDRALVADVSTGDVMAGWSPLVDAKVRELMALAEPPTAIFASCDAVARDVYRTAAALGLRIPADLSVVGFDDDPIAQFVDPPLTTARQPFEAMGQAAFALLAQRMAEPAAAVEHRVLPVTVVARSSLGPPRRR